MASPSTNTLRPAKASILFIRSLFLFIIQIPLTTCSEDDLRGLPQIVHNKSGTPDRGHVPFRLIMIIHQHSSATGTVPSLHIVENIAHEPGIPQVEPVLESCLVNQAGLRLPAETLDG